MKKVLELPAFRRLLVAYTLNELAASIGAVALALLVYRRTGSALGAAGFFLCAEFVPALVSPLFVARLDQRSVRRVLGLLYTLQALIFLVLGWLVNRFAVAPVLVLAVIDGILAVTARVITRSTWTAVSRKRGLLREANAIINGSFSTCFLVGPALGGGVVALGGTRAALYVNVGVFSLIAATVATARGMPQGESEPEPAITRLRAAISRIRTEPPIRRLLGLQALGMFFFTISIPVEVVFAQHTLHAGAGGYGLLLSSWGAGAILGSAGYARWRALPSRVLITLGATLLGVGFLAMAGSPSLPVAIAAGAIAGVGNGIQIVAMRTELQEVAPLQWMALILSFNEAMLQAVPGAGILVGGGITLLAGPRPAFVVAGAGAVFVAAAMWLKLSGTDETTATAQTVQDAKISDGPLTASSQRP